VRGLVVEAQSLTGKDSAMPSVALLLAREPVLEPEAGHRWS
jgi:hypothetical protein